MRDETGAAILLIDDDAFQSGYVGVALDRCGAPFVGPITSIAAAEEAIARTPGLSAVVIGGRIPAPEADALAARLGADGIACLILDRSPAFCTILDGPVCHLPQPFAAFQVLDWLRAHMPADAVTAAGTSARPG